LRSGRRNRRKTVRLNLFAAFPAILCGRECVGFGYPTAFAASWNFSGIEMFLVDNPAHRRRERLGVS